MLLPIGRCCRSLSSALGFAAEILNFFFACRRPAGDQQARADAELFEPRDELFAKSALFFWFFGLRLVGLQLELFADIFL